MGKARIVLCSIDDGLAEAVHKWATPKLLEVYESDLSAAMDDPPDVAVVEITDDGVVMNLSPMSSDNGRPGSVTIAVVPEHLDPSLATKALAMGAFISLRQPFDPEHLYHYLDRALELSTLTRSVGSGPKIKEPGADDSDGQEKHNLKLTRMLVKMLETKDPFMEHHSEKVTKLAGFLAGHLDLGQEQVDAINTGALLHDIGNLGVSDLILQKEGRLANDEYFRAMTHTDLGAAILSTVFSHQTVLDIARYHHERWDGHGPYGLQGPEIPLEARIVGVADAYDAMTCTRHYRPARGPAEARLEMKKMSGSQFDPDLVVSFFECGAPKIIE